MPANNIYSPPRCRSKEVPMRSPNLVNADDLPWVDEARGERFGFRRRQLGAAAGGRMLGCSLYELPPGRCSWPYHYHLANEEAIYVLEGEGTLRLAGTERALRPGDYVALPPGEGSAHQVVNRSGAPLRYLCFSTMVEPEISVYPESGKIGVFAGSAPGGAKEARTFQGFYPRRAAVDYWFGEK
jgi:uncharacterized cupin superfamily protein